eukprot:Sspe_Gene.47783::Locus_24537_Transcript_1_1_Confidence_1.000_Length_5334::g.47783::m.47783
MKLSAKFLIFCSGLISFSASLAGGLVLYFEGLALLEDTIEQLSQADVKAVTGKFDSSLQVVEINAAVISDVVQNWDGYKTPSELGVLTKHLALPSLVHNPHLYCIGVVAVPLENTSENPGGMYDLSWYDLDLSQERVYIHGHYDSTLWNSSNCSQEGRCVHAWRVSPATGQEVQLEYTYVDNLINALNTQFLSKQEGWASGRSSKWWRKPAVWYAADGTPNLYMGYHHVLAPLPHPQWAGMKVVACGYIMLTTWERELKEFSTPAHLVMTTLQDGLESIVVGSNMNFSLATAGCTRSKTSYTTLQQCIPQLWQWPALVSDAAVVLNKTHGIFRRIEAGGQEVWGRLDVAHTPGVLDDSPAFYLLWIRPVTAEDEMNSAVKTFIIFVCLVFILDASVGVVEVLFIERPLSKLTEAIEPLQSLNVDVTEARLAKLQSRCLVVSEVMQLFDGFSFVVNALQGFRVYVPMHLYDTKELVTTSSDDDRVDTTSSLCAPSQLLSFSTCPPGNITLVLLECTPLQSEGSCEVQVGEMFNTVVERCVAGHCGTVIRRKHTLSGDSFAVAFITPMAGVHFAFDIMLELREITWPGPDKWDGPQVKYVLVQGDARSDVEPRGENLVELAAAIACRVSHGVLVAMQNDLKADIGDSQPMTIFPYGTKGMVGVLPQELSSQKEKLQQKTSHGDATERDGLVSIRSLVVAVELVWGDAEQCERDLVVRLVGELSERTRGRLVALFGSTLVLMWGFKAKVDVFMFLGRLLSAVPFSWSSRIGVGVAEGEVQRVGVGGKKQRFLTYFGKPVEVSKGYASEALSQGVVGLCDGSLFEVPELRPFLRKLAGEEGTYKMHPLAFAFPEEFNVRKGYVWGDKGSQFIPQSAVGPLGEAQEGNRLQAASQPYSVHRSSNHPLESMSYFVATDIDQADILWKTFLSEMREASALVQGTLRRCLAEEPESLELHVGDVNLYYFPTYASALAFCLAVQRQLLTCPWPEEMLKHPLCQCTRPGGTVLWCGLRVRMAVYSCMGWISSNPVTGKATVLGRGPFVVQQLLSKTQGGLIAVCCEAREEGVEGVATLDYGTVSIDDEAFRVKCCIPAELWQRRKVLRPMNVGRWHLSRLFFSDADTAADRVRKWVTFPILFCSLLSIFAVVRAVSSRHYVLLALRLPCFVSGLYLTAKILYTKRLRQGESIWITVVGLLFCLTQDIVTFGTWELWVAGLPCIMVMLVIEEPSAARGFAAASLIHNTLRIAEELWGFGLYDMFPNEHALVPTRRSEGWMVLVPGLFRSCTIIVTYLVSSYVTWGKRKHIDSTNQFTAVVQSITNSLTRYDLETARRMLLPDVLPHQLLSSLKTLISQMAVIRPYIPHACLEESDDDDVVRHPSEEASVSKSRASSMVLSEGSGQDDPVLRFTSQEVTHKQALKEKRVTIAVVSSVGFQCMLKERHMASLVEYHEMYLTTLISKAQAWCGVAEGFEGDFVQFSFNAVKTVFSHQQNAVHFALAVQDDVPTMDHLASELFHSHPGYQVRVGICTGMAWCGSIGSSAMRGYAVLGDVARDAVTAQQCAVFLNAGILCDSVIAKAGQGFFTISLVNQVVASEGPPMLLWQVLGQRGQENTEWMYTLQDTSWAAHNKIMGYIVRGDVDIAQECLAECDLASLPMLDKLLEHLEAAKQGRFSSLSSGVRHLRVEAKKRECVPPPPAASQPRELTLATVSPVDSPDTKCLTPS